MGWISRAILALKLDNDALAAYRERICLRFSRLCALILVPFILLHLVSGHWVMLGLNSMVAGMMLTNAWALSRERTPPMPFWVLCGIIVGVLCASVLEQGTYGVLWSYPVLFLLFFVLPRRVAMAMAAVLLVAVTSVAGVAISAPLAVRALASLGFILMMIHVVLNVIGELQEALVTQAITDPLTGAFNRRHLQSHLGERVAPVAAPADENSLLMIDIDHFKRINDELGHDVGDLVLCRLVAAVGARKRSGDLLFRTGGEEFVLLLPLTPPEAALSVAEDLRGRLARAELLPGKAVTVSIGVSTLADGQTAEEWVKAADTALYEAKRGGRNRVVVAAAA